MRTGEGAFLVTEQFAFDEVGGQRGAIYFYQSTIFPVARSVDCPRDQLFACSRLAQDKYGGIAACNLFDLVKHVFEPVASTDNVLVVVFNPDFFLQICFFRFQLVF